MPGLEELKGLVRILKSGVHFHMSNMPLIDWAIQTIERLQRELKSAHEEFDGLARECSQLEDDLDYSAGLVLERDAEIQKLREQIVTLSDPCKLAQALSEFTAKQSELALTEKDGTC